MIVHMHAHAPGGRCLQFELLRLTRSGEGMGSSVYPHPVSSWDGIRTSQHLFGTVIEPTPSLCTSIVESAGLRR